MVGMQPTSPRVSSDLDKALQKIKANKYDSLYQHAKLKTTLPEANANNAP